MRCDIAVDIDSCPDHVWAVLTDVSRWPQWTGAIREVAVLGGGPLVLDSALRLHVLRVPERTWRVSELTGRRHRLTLRGEGLGGGSIVRFRLTRRDPEAGGDTPLSRLQVTHERAGRLGTAIARLTGRTVDAQLQMLVGDLKDHCETRRRASLPSV